MGEKAHLPEKKPTKEEENANNVPSEQVEHAQMEISDQTIGGDIETGLEELDIENEDFDVLNNQLDQLSSALDDIETKNDNIHSQLLDLLQANRMIREQIRESNLQTGSELENDKDLEPPQQN